MKVTWKKLLETLGVNRELGAYETHPWMHYDDEKGITASAEVRAGAGLQNAEAEIQFLYDDPEEHQKTNPEQIMLMRMAPKGSEWSPNFLLVKGDDYVNKIGGWDEKGCNFFRACIQDMQMGKLPDIDELIKKHLPDDDGDGRRGRGKIGRKSPKASTNALLGMKKGM